MQAPGKNFFVFANPAAAPFPFPPPAGERRKKGAFRCPSAAKKSIFMRYIHIFSAPCNASFTSA